MKILVTGGAGFIGSNLIKRLNTPQNNIVSLDNYSTGYIKNHHKGVTYINGNTWEILDIEELKYFKPDIIFHFGEYSRIHQSFQEISEVYSSNCLGTQQVLEYALINNSFLIYSGSSAIFGDDTKKNLSPYAFTKSKNIELIHNYNKWFNTRLKFAICYFYNVYGPGQIQTGNYATVIGIFEEQYKNNLPFTVVKPGTQKRCFTHIDDIIDGIILVSEKGEGDGYLLGNNEEYSILDIVKLFDTDFVYLQERKGERYKSAFYDSKTIELGWSPKNSLKKYIKTLL